MKKVTTSEANREFTNVTKMVDKEGEVTLTKHGKEKYVLMTMEKYEGREKFDKEMKIKAEEGFWIKDNKTLWHIQNTNEVFTIVKAEFNENELDYYKVITLPESSVSFVKPMTIHLEKKGNITIEAREAGYENDELEEYVNNITKKITTIEGKVTGFKEALA